MIYHGMVAMAGVLVLLGGWLLAQRLSVSAGSPGRFGPVDCILPGDAQATAACGGCEACAPGSERPEPPFLTGELARDGPATDLRQ